jgi:hypothetical protein
MYRYVCIYIYIYMYNGPSHTTTGRGEGVKIERGKNQQKIKPTNFSPRGSPRIDRFEKSSAADEDEWLDRF